jgi:hypothetical protein
MADHAPSHLDGLIGHDAKNGNVGERLAKPVEGCGRQHREEGSGPQLLGDVVQGRRLDAEDDDVDIL